MLHKSFLNAAVFCLVFQITELVVFDYHNYVLHLKGATENSVTSVLSIIMYLKIMK